MNRVISIAAAFALMLQAGAAHAQVASPREARSVPVGYLDLDLNSAAGRATLERRIKSAVAQVCGPRPAPVELGNGKTYRRCTTEALEGSRRQMAKLTGNEAIAENVIQVAAPNR